MYDRANSARRLMKQDGLRADQVSQVRGYADQKLRNPTDPFDPSNRRITVIVHYIEKPTWEKDDAPAEKSEESKEGEKPSPQKTEPTQNAAPEQKTGQEQKTIQEKPSPEKPK